jgi:hypothetical protein
VILEESAQARPRSLVGAPGEDRRDQSSKDSRLAGYPECRNSSGFRHVEMGDGDPWLRDSPVSAEGVPHHKSLGGFSAELFP